VSAAGATGSTGLFTAGISNFDIYAAANATYKAVVREFTILRIKLGLEKLF
jgi:hypothetical protein